MTTKFPARGSSAAKVTPPDAALPPCQGGPRAFPFLATCVLKGLLVALSFSALLVAALVLGG